MLSETPMHTSLPASDLARARRFYVEVLGFAPANEDPHAIQFRSGGTVFVVYQSGGSSPGTFSQAGWAVGDIRKEVDALRERGVEFLEYDFPGLKTKDGIAEVEGSFHAWFKDTEGNLLGIEEWPDDNQWGKVARGLDS